MNPVRVDGSVVAKLCRLQPKSVPGNLAQWCPRRTKRDFDPNTYFTVLTHLRMKAGYTLDYDYHYDKSFGGMPSLCAKQTDETAKDESFKDRNLGKELQRCGVETLGAIDRAHKIIMLSHIAADGTPDGFFQLAVFLQLAEQFYLSWHFQYKDIKIVTSRDEMEAIISEADGRGNFTEEQVAAFREVPFEPTVELQDDSACVIYCTFTKWGGLKRIKETYMKEPPHFIVSTDVLAEVRYDCGMCF